MGAHFSHRTTLPGQWDQGKTTAPYHPDPSRGRFTERTSNRSLHDRG
ncbi:hypothetical protein [Streptomyces sioyaensis]